MRRLILALCALCSANPLCGNQTTDLSPVLPEAVLPFTLRVDVADFSLPTGIQSFAGAVYDGKWLLLAGRTNGLHGFSNVGNNFPPSFQNRNVYVIDPSTGKSWSKSLLDGGLVQEQIDALSTTASQSFQNEDTLYLVGGYGINHMTGEMGTKSTLTAINIKLMMDWVISGNTSLKSALTQTSHPSLQVTGGALFQANPHQPMLLILGQNFTGLYTASANGAYTRQIRPFRIAESNDEIGILSKPSEIEFPTYRRRDLNVVPILQNNKLAYVALGGVFTLDTGVWTVPITIFPDGRSIENDPADPKTFKQAMNHYNCAAFGLYSTRSKEMFVVLPGGISFGFFSDGVFTTDTEIPFINQITTIKIDKERTFTQHLMDSEYPVILSTGSNPGNRLIFGAEAVFIPKADIPLFSNGVIQLDALPKGPTVIGYIVGGIMSTLPNTNTAADSTASPYVFAVTLISK